MVNYPTPQFEQKICSAHTLSARLQTLGAPVVFTNGCFDILHRGHVTYLAQARALGASLVVGVNSDASVKRLAKGPERPLNGEADRMAVLAALEAVSLVTLFEDDTPLQLILKVRPQILVKGGDWPPDQIIGHQEVLAWGGSVHAIPFLHQRSTTAIVQRIRQ